MLALFLTFLLSTPPAGEAHSVAPEQARASFELLVKQAKSAQENNRTDEALALYRKAVALRPAWDDGWWSIGMLTYDKDAYSECTAAFRRLRSLKPDLAPAWTMSGLCEYRLREYDAASRSLLEAERLGFQGSAELARSGRLHLALLLTKNSNFEHALLLCGLLFRSADSTPEVVAAAGVAGLGRPLLLKDVPESDRPLVMTLGGALEAAFAKSAAEAIKEFQAAVQTYPDEADIHYRFGAFLVKNEPARGLAEIRRALELNPSHLPALITLSLESLNADDYAAARGYAERAVRAAPDNFAAHLMFGRSLLLETKSRELDSAPAKPAPPAKATSPSKARPISPTLRDAVHELELAVRLAPESQDAHFSLSSAYALAGRNADAARERTEYERLRKLDNARTGR